MPCRGHLAEASRLPGQRSHGHPLVKISSEISGPRGLTPAGRGVVMKISCGGPMLIIRGAVLLMTTRCTRPGLEGECRSLPPPSRASYTAAGCRGSAGRCERREEEVNARTSDAVTEARGSLGCRMHADGGGCRGGRHGGSGCRHRSPASAAGIHLQQGCGLRAADGVDHPPGPWQDLQARVPRSRCRPARWQERGRSRR
jgi:hypothetical protein